MLGKRYLYHLQGHMNFFTGSCAMLGKRFFLTFQDIKYLYRELCNFGQTLLTHIISVGELCNVGQTLLNLYKNIFIGNCAMLGKRY